MQPPTQSCPQLAPKALPSSAGHSPFTAAPKEQAPAFKASFWEHCSIPGVTSTGPDLGTDGTGHSRGQLGSQGGRLGHLDSHSL